ncbi:MAG: efflux RND transporter periplasmic adaptor subunit [Gammaproteobacteria bacterium]
MMRTRYLLLAVFIVVIAAVSAAGGFWWAHRSTEMAMPQTDTGTQMSVTAAANNSVTPEPGVTHERTVLYWYDPMQPQQHFDKPGKSPFMDMELIPKYADGADTTSAIRIDPSMTQNVGMRLATVSLSTFRHQLDSVGTLAFNGRDVTVVQARSGGYVERIYPHAPGDMVDAGAPLADLLMPEWAGAQKEFLALVDTADAKLINAARERLSLRGMPSALITRVERTRTLHPIYTVTTPSSGVIESQDVRAGMTVNAGQTLATIRGIDSVWLEVAVPEASGGWVNADDKVEARFAAFPGESVAGKVIAVLPTANSDSRTLTLRVEFANGDGRLRPGMYANVRVTGGDSKEALTVPTEAIIRTGKRNIVMLAEDEGRYRPVEIQTGRESDGHTEVLDGLTEGQRVVVSGQFLIDSEASLAGLMAHTSEEKRDTTHD